MRDSYIAFDTFLVLSYFVYAWGLLLNTSRGAWSQINEIYDGLCYIYGE